MGRSFETSWHHIGGVEQTPVGVEPKEVEYLGDMISGEGVSMDDKKSESVQRWPTSVNVKGVRGFLGLTGYYRKFIKGYEILPKPLTELLEKKNNFKWNKKTQKAFEQLKTAISTAPVLWLPDFNKDLMIEYDGSGKGI